MSLTPTDPVTIADVGSPPDPLLVSQDSSQIQEIRHRIILRQKEDGGHSWVIRDTDRAQTLGGHGERPQCLQTHEGGDRE